MGLSSKQVSSDRLDWTKHLSQAHQNLELPKRTSVKRQLQRQGDQSSEPLKCPRCDSTNTKFCYFNNYSESQPRHYCKACKRHWTKGGTLRNLPVGGGRKKRIKRNTTVSTSATSAAATNEASHGSQQRQDLMPQEPVGRRNLDEALYQPMNHQTSMMLQHDHLMGLTLTQPQSQCLQFPFSSSSCFEPSIVFDHGDELIRSVEDPKGIMSSTSGTYAETWQAPLFSSVQDISHTWNWEDIESLVSTDLNVPWEDSDIKL